MSKKVYPPLKALKYMTQKYPTAWESIDEVREYAKNIDDELVKTKFERCFIPEQTVEAYVKEQYTIIRNQKELDYDTTAITVLASWRQYKQVYKFDKDLQDLLFLQVGDSKDVVDIPLSVMFNLPYDCIFIESNFNNDKFNGYEIQTNQKIVGFFTTFDHYMTEKGMQCALRLSFLTEEGIFAYHPLVLLDNENNIFEYVNIHVESWKKDLNSSVSKDAEKAIGNLFQEYINKAIQLVLYICAKNAEVTENREQAQIYKPKKQGAKDKFTDIRKWDVGLRIGQEIRMMGKVEDRKPIFLEDTGSLIEFTRNPMRPHTRRGHWHNYWTGSRDNPEERKLVLKWVAPTMINVKDVEEDLPIAKSELTI